MKLKNELHINDTVLVNYQGKVTLGIIINIEYTEEELIHPYTYEVYVSPTKTYFYKQEEINKVKVDPDVALRIVNLWGKLQE